MLSNYRESEEQGEITYVRTLSPRKFAPSVVVVVLTFVQRLPGERTYASPGLEPQQDGRELEHVPVW